MSEGTKLGSHDSRLRHVHAEDVQLQHPEDVLKTYQRKKWTRSIAELDHQRLPPGTGSENGAVTRQPGDQESIATNVGNLAALSRAEESILITPRDVQMQRPEVLLKTYQKRYSGSYKHIAADGTSASSVELGHQSQRLTGTGSEDGIITRRPDDKNQSLLMLGTWLRYR